MKGEPGEAPVMGEAEGLFGVTRDGEERAAGFATDQREDGDGLFLRGK